jgi:hypothetical protein
MSEDRYQRTILARSQPMSELSDSPPDDVPTDPDSALEACRKADLVEGQWCYDVRAGYARIKSLSQNAVIFRTETGQKTAIDPVELYKSYRQNCIYPIT